MTSAGSWLQFLASLVLTIFCGEHQKLTPPASSFLKAGCYLPILFGAGAWKPSRTGPITTRFLTSALSPVVMGYTGIHYIPHNFCYIEVDFMIEIRRWGFPPILLSLKRNEVEISPHARSRMSTFFHLPTDAIPVSRIASKIILWFVHRLYFGNLYYIIYRSLSLSLDFMMIFFYGTHLEARNEDTDQYPKLCEMVKTSNC